MAGKGGKRHGAGRKRKAVTIAKQGFASQVFPDELELELWQELLNSTDLRVRFDAVRYLSDQKHGKAPQSMTLRGDSERPIELVVRVLCGNSPTAEAG